MRLGQVSCLLHTQYTTAGSVLLISRHTEVTRITGRQENCESGAKVLREHRGVTGTLVIKEDKQRMVEPMA